MVRYTDGITEALNVKTEEFGDSRLIDVIRRFNRTTAEELRDAIYDEVMRFSNNTSQYDDTTLIVLKIK